MDRPEFKLNSDIVKLLLNNILSYIKIGVKSLALIGGETLIWLDLNISGFQERETVRSAASSRQGGDRAPGVDRQIAHLSALLAESEAQNGRLEKLTEVGKDTRFNKKI